MDLVLKEYKKEHLEFIVRIAKEEIGSHHPEQNFLETDIENRLKKNETYVIYYRNRLAGFISYRETPFILFPLFRQKRLFVDLIGFEKQFQQRGLGKKLISKLEQEAKNRKIKSIYGYVIKNNQQSVKIWEHFGAKITGKVKNHLIMEKKLKNK